MRHHSFSQLLQTPVSPESVPSDPAMRQRLQGLQSRYQRYEMMSCIPIAILIRTLRDKFFQEEINSIIKAEKQKHNKYFKAQKPT